MRLSSSDGLVERRVNSHVHSTHSDGQLSPERIVAEAEEGDFYVGLTDHNTADAHRTFRHPRVFGGIEVTAEPDAGGVDVVLLADDPDTIVAFDDECVLPFLDNASRFLPIKRGILEVLEDAERFGLQVQIPHYDHHDGISMLDRRTQDEILARELLVELNGQLSDESNEEARKLAERTGHPLIAADDSHCAEQYARTWTAVAMDPSEPVKPSVLWNLLRRNPKNATFAIRPPKPREVLRTVRQVANAIGLKTLGKMALWKLLHLRRMKMKTA